MRALIIDGDASIRRTIHDVVSEVGCDDVSFAEWDDEVLSLAEALPDLDLIVLAFELRELPGLELCGVLATRFPNVPILVLTATNEVASLQAAFAAGAQDVISTPLRVGELDARARHALRRRAAWQSSLQREEQLTLRAHRLEQSKDDLERVACVDQLTGIANRRHFDDLLQLEWRRAIRAGSALSLVILDLDSFHALNERYGHLGGDLRLKRVADAMAHCLRRPSDLLARYGGEEFVALLPDTDTAGACVVAERLRLAVEELQLPHEASRHAVVTISAGVATGAPSADGDPETLVAAADAALFRAKDGGRNRYCADATAPSAVTVNRRPWPICPVAVVDPFLVQRIPNFLEGCTSELRATRDAAKHGEFGNVGRMGRTLEEAASGLGIEALAELGSRVVDASQRAQLDEALEILDELAWYLMHVQVVYRRPMLRAM